MHMYICVYTHTHTHRERERERQRERDFILEIQMIKNPPAMQRPGFDPWVGRFPGGGDGYPVQYSCLENSMDRGARWAITAHGVTKSQRQLREEAHVRAHAHTHSLYIYVQYIYMHLLSDIYIVPIRVLNIKSGLCFIEKQIRVFLKPAAIISYINE